jgi:tetratricopeptide (TPR) repeat protein
MTTAKQEEYDEEIESLERPLSPVEKLAKLNHLASIAKELMPDSQTLTDLKFEIASNYISSNNLDAGIETLNEAFFSAKNNIKSLIKEEQVHALESTCQKTWDIISTAQLSPHHLAKLINTLDSATKEMKKAFPHDKELTMFYSKALLYAVTNVHQIGISLFQESKFIEMKEIFENTSQILEKHFPEDLHLAQALSNLGLAHYKLGNFLQSIEFAKASLAMAKADLLIKKNAETIISISCKALAQVTNNDTKYELIKQALEESINKEELLKTDCKILGFEDLSGCESAIMQEL